MPKTVLSKSNITVNTWSVLFTNDEKDSWGGGGEGGGRGGGRRGGRGGGRGWLAC